MGDSSPKDKAKKQKVKDDAKSAAERKAQAAKDAKANATKPGAKK